MKPSQLIRYLPGALRDHETVMVIGTPGAGKSAIGEHVVEDVLKWELMVSHPVIEDPTKYAGQPWVVQTPDGAKALHIPYEDLQRLITADHPIVLLIDDLGQAPMATQAAIMQLPQARRIGEHKISDHVRFLICSNRREDRAGVGTIIEPLKDRCTIVTLEPFMGDLIDYAISKNWPAHLIAFMKFRPTIIDGWKPDKGFANGCTPRGLERLGKQVARDLDADLRVEAYAGAVGQGVASEFLTFEQLYQQLPQVELVLTDPANVPVPDKANVLYALSGALAARADAKTFSNILVFAARMPKEFSILLVKMAIQRNPKLQAAPGYTQWYAAHHDVII